jgi:hypothetical protein
VLLASSCESQELCLMPSVSLLLLQQLQVL